MNKLLGLRFAWDEIFQELDLNNCHKDIYSLNFILAEIFRLMLSGVVQHFRPYLF